MHHEQRTVLCWSRMQGEAGQPLQDIILRKELERRTGSGLFFWGVGNAPGPTALKLAANGETPHVVFSVMKGRAKAADLQPTSLLVWRAYIGADGRERPLPEHCLVTSRVRSGTSELAPRHYALICRSEEELILADYGSFDPGGYRNLGGTGAPVGASQVTALLRWTGLSGEGTKYRVNLKARLDLDLWVRLADPVPLRGGRREAMHAIKRDLADQAWVEMVSWIKDEPRRRVVPSSRQIPLF